MRIALLYGNPNTEDREFLDYLEHLSNALPDGHSLDFWDIEKMDLRYCTGCWTCWWETPGRCVHKDDGPHIFKSVINADLLILASPLIAGFTSSTLKRICDRLIVLLHPYITFIHNESHHRKRYDKYPAMALLLKKEAGTDQEDIRIVKDIYDRFAINFHSRVVHMNFIEDASPTQFVHEIVSGKKEVIL
jgi:multimeric flavodoxin WrbA